MTEFEKALEFTARWEGGYANHPADKGGETNFGVTTRVWQNWCRAQGLPLKPMRALTVEDVRPLYEAWYWQPLAASLAWPLSAAVYDVYVNHGPGNAKRLLAEARAACPNGTPLEQALALVDARVRFYRAIVANDASQEGFLKGWLNRAMAQLQWLKANAQPPAPPRVLLVPQGGGEPVPWDGRPARYGGVLLDEALVAQLRLVYPSACGPWTYQTLRGWVRNNGDLVLERLPQTIPATPQT